MESKRFVASVNITIEATDPGEAEMMLERALAGLAEYQVVEVFAEDADA